MSETLFRSEPVSADRFTSQRAEIGLAPPMARFSLRARDPRTLEEALAIKLPTKIGSTLGDAVCLGPDEWLLRAPSGTVLPATEGLPLATVDISERAVCFIVEGAQAAEVLMSGCPLDLERFAVGRGTRTVFETVEIVLLRKGDERFEVEVWRSFAPWLKTALETAARQLR